MLSWNSDQIFYRPSYSREISSSVFGQTRCTGLYPYLNIWLSALQSSPVWSSSNHTMTKDIKRKFSIKTFLRASNAQASLSLLLLACDARPVKYVFENFLRLEGLVVLGKEGGLHVLQLQTWSLPLLTHMNCVNHVSIHSKSWSPWSPDSADNL